MSLEIVDAPPALGVQGLRAGYGRGDVVRDVDLAVAGGKTVLLVGHNGAGKTTILRAIMGLCPVVGGRISVAGTDMSSASSAVRAQHRMSYVMQERGTFRGLSVMENLEVVARLAGLTRRPARVRALQRVYDWFPRIHERRSSPARALSGGESRMLAISLGLLRDPLVMLLDEPTLGLAPATAETMVATLARIQQDTGMALVVTESALTAVRTLGGRMQIVRRGGLSAPVDPDAPIDSLDDVL